MPAKPKSYSPDGKTPDQRRGTATQRGYDVHWRRARLAFLREHPLCVTCLDEGRTIAATIVDHKIPHRGSEALFWDEGNWQALCFRHHAAKTGAGL